MFVLCHILIYNIKFIEISAGKILPLQIKNRVQGICCRLFITKTQITMKKYILLLWAVCVSFAAVAQTNGSVADYFSAKIDSLVCDTMFVSAVDSSEVSANPVYIKLLTTPVLYNSVVNRAFGSGFDVDSISGENGLIHDEKRSAVIDKVLLEIYRKYPSKIRVTEDRLRDETSVPAMESIDKVSKIQFDNNPIADIPENVTGGLKTTVKKPSYWRTSGSFDLKFTQNYVSRNWSQGGDNSRTMLAILVFNFNYDDKDRITFTNKFDAQLGFTTVEGDTLHSFKTNNDKLRLESTLGYKLVNKLDLTAKSKLETQALPNYPTNSYDFVSKFMAPFDATFSVGVNYKPTWKNLSLTIFLAPLSAYNYRFVRYDHLVTRYGIRNTRHHREDFGTQLVVEVPRATFFNILNWWSRAEFYTNYARSFFSWENKFDVKLNRYFSVSMLVNTRFDDSSPGLKDDKYGYLQLKEYMTLGFTYSW